MREITVRIPAIHCAACINTVKWTLRSVQGVQVIDANARAKRVLLRVIDLDAQTRALAELDAIGYMAEIVTD